jgi:peptidoglycan LD-endopeptidase LytH
MTGFVLGAIIFFVAAIFWGGYAFLARHFRDDGGRTEALLRFLNDPVQYSNWKIRAGTRCSPAPFAFPTDGYIGYVWGDMFQAFHRHQGLDIFGGSAPGATAVYSVSDGLLTRLPDWKSAVIVRVPNDPLHPGTEICVYYAHMAAPDGTTYIGAAFPAGIVDAPVRSGTLLGYQGNYTGDPTLPAGVHLHLSIVKSNGTGGWRNELDIDNTLDPSPYFGLPLRYGSAASGPIICRE